MFQPINTEDLLQRDLHMGIEAKNFMRTNIWKYIDQKITQKCISAMHNLRNCDPNDWKKVQEFQNEINVAELGRVFLMEAISEGYNAQKLIDENELESPYKLSDFAGNELYEEDDGNNYVD